MQSKKNHTLYTALRQCWTVPRLKKTSGYGAILFILIVQISFLAPTLDNTDPFFALVIAPGFYLHHIEVADRGPASSSV